MGISKCYQNFFKTLRQEGIAITALDPAKPHQNIIPVHVITAWFNAKNDQKEHFEDTMVVKALEDELDIEGELRFDGFHNTYAWFYAFDLSHGYGSFDSFIPFVNAYMKNGDPSDVDGKGKLKKQMDLLSRYFDAVNKFIQEL